MSAGTAALLLLAFSGQAGGGATCEQLRAEADRLQAQIDGLINESQDARLASMRARREARAQERATGLASMVPIIGGYIADALNMATEARQQRLDERSDQLGDQLASDAPQLGRSLADLELAYEMRCRRPAAAQAQEARP
jgi:outer membrane murein-binding lipoprotein Lpp